MPRYTTKEERVQIYNFYRNKGCSVTDDFASGFTSVSVLGTIEATAPI